MKRVWTGTLVLLLASAVWLGAEPAAADSHGFDRAKAHASAIKLADQVKAIEGDLKNVPEGSAGAPTPALMHDLRHIEGHARHLARGIDAGLQEKTMKSSAKQIKALVEEAHKDAQALKLATPVQAKIEAADATATGLLAQYGVAAPDVGSK